MVTGFCVTMLIARSMVTQHRVTMPPPKVMQCAALSLELRGSAVPQRIEWTLGGGPSLEGRTMKTFAGTLLVALMAVAATAAAPPQPGLVGKAAPEISAKYWINTPPLTLAGLRGKIVVVEFWATWCPPCRKSIPHLIELYKKYADKGVAIIGLTNEPQEKVEPFVKELGMTYAVGGGSNSGGAYGVTGIPTAFLVDTKGQVVWQGHPMQPDFEKAIEQQLKTSPPSTPPAKPKK